MSLGRAALRTALVAAAVIVADQLAKVIVRAEISPNEAIELVLGIKLIRTRNTGVAFSMFSGEGPLVAIVLVVAFIALVGFFVTHLRRPLMWLPTGLVLGGAAGNVIDRVRTGGVTDFVKLPHWPAFNVADVCIIAGMVLLIFMLNRR